MKTRTTIPTANPIMILLLVMFFAGQLFGQNQENSDVPQTIQELEKEIKKVLKETNTPALGVALVDQEGPVWIAGLGKADVEKDKEANENTMFRIGSTSKMFVSLAILKLQEEGRLSLKDKVRDLVPEVEFKNKWEETAPILVEHLLEHTTGWDDFHLPEYAHNDSIPINLKDGLEFHPHSRISRWMPGTRMSYCNSGPGVAAYIVEKVSGKPFEGYIQENFFGPMGMENTTYFLSEAYQQYGATLYLEEKPQDYWHIVMRPSGSINASPKDMAKMVRFFVNRGRVDSLQLISDQSLKRMETPSTTLGAMAGMELGYGLSNYSTPFKGFIYRTHNGGVNGGLSELSYLPEYGVGYSILINAGNGDALYRISNLIREFQTKDFKAPKTNQHTPLDIEQADLSGYYTSINPRMQMSYFIERLLNVQKMWHQGDTVFTKGLLGGDAKSFLAVDPILYGSTETGKNVVARVIDPIAGEVIHIDSQVWKRTSPLLIFGQLGLGALWVLFMVSALIFGPIWFIRYKKGKISGGPNIWVRLWPLLASVFFLVFIVLVFLGLANPFELLGKVSVVSVSIMFITIGFALSAVWSIISIIKERHAKINRMAYWHAALLSGLHLMVAFYFLWFGVIGLQTWA